MCPPLQQILVILRWCVSEKIEMSLTYIDDKDTYEDLHIDCRLSMFPFTYWHVYLHV